MSFLAAALPLGLGALGAGGSAIRGSKKPKKVGLLSPGQQDIQSLIQAAIQGQGPLANITSNDPQQSAQRFSQAVAEPLITQFQEEILPSITGQFRGKGLGQSTFAGQAAARAGEGLERQLASGLSQFQSSQDQQAASNLMRLLGLSQGTKEFGFQQPQASPLDAILAQVTGAGLDIGGKLFGSPGFGGKFSF